MSDMMSEYPISGLKLYTAEWRGTSRGWRLNDPWAYKFSNAPSNSESNKNIHVRTRVRQSIRSAWTHSMCVTSITPRPTFPI